MNTIIIDNILLKAFDDKYYVSEYGDVYSMYSKKFLKHNIDCDGYHRVDIHQKHFKIHKLVFLVWGGTPINGRQINHIDDNKDNNHISNLYLGTQKQNIKDCKNNNHRVGNIKAVTVRDRRTDRIIKYPSVKELINATGHSIPNNSLSKLLSRKWFNDRYEVLKVEGVETIESYNAIKQKWHEDKVS